MHSRVILRDVSRQKEIEDIGLNVDGQRVFADDRIDPSAVRADARLHDGSAVVVLDERVRVLGKQRRELCRVDRVRSDARFLPVHRRPDSVRPAVIDGHHQRRERDRRVEARTVVLDRDLADVRLLQHVGDVGRVGGDRTPPSCVDTQ